MCMCACIYAENTHVCGCVRVCLCVLVCYTPLVYVCDGGWSALLYLLSVTVSGEGCDWAPVKGGLRLKCGRNAVSIGAFPFLPVPAPVLPHTGGPCQAAKLYSTLSITLLKHCCSGGCTLVICVCLCVCAYVALFFLGGQAQSARHPIAITNFIIIIILQKTPAQPKWPSCFLWNVCRLIQHVESGTEAIGERNHSDWLFS